MKKSTRIFSLFIALMMIALTVPALAAAKKTKEAPSVDATVAGGATLLSKPRADGEFVAGLSDGDEVKVSVIGLAWCKARAGDQEGYVSSRLLRFSDASESETFAIVNAKNGRLTLRQKDSTKSKALGKYNNGNVVAVLEKGDKFTKVAVAGKEGYLLTEHLAFSAPQEGQGTGTVIWPEKTKGTRMIKLRWSEKSGDNVVTSIETGTEFVLLNKGDDWCRIEVKGKVGYMMTKYLEIDEGVGSSGGALPIGAAPAVPQTGGQQPASAPAAGAKPTAQPKATPKPKATPAPTQEPGEYLDPGELDELIPVD